MQIRSQYLIQDNHDDYTSQSAFSRAGNVCTQNAPPFGSSFSSFFPARLSFPPSHGVWLELASAPIAPRRGLVAKMHRCLSYNMLAMHLERGHRSRNETTRRPGNTLLSFEEFSFGIGISDMVLLDLDDFFFILFDRLILEK